MKKKQKQKTKAKTKGRETLDLPVIKCIMQIYFIKLHLVFIMLKFGVIKKNNDKYNDNLSITALKFEYKDNFASEITLYL